MKKKIQRKGAKTQRREGKNAQAAEYPVKILGDAGCVVHVAWSDDCVTAMLHNGPSGLPSIVHDEQGETFLHDGFTVWHFAEGHDAAFRKKVIAHSPVWKALNETLRHHAQVMGWTKTLQNLLTPNS